MSSLIHQRVGLVLPSLLLALHRHASFIYGALLRTSEEPPSYQGEQHRLGHVCGGMGRASRPVSRARLRLYLSNPFCQHQSRFIINN